ncbi:unnamed protein product [Penicillium salamii]|nr:unnamed protein product [Penicillium salamii]
MLKRARGTCTLVLMVRRYNRVPGYSSSTSILSELGSARTGIKTAAFTLQLVLFSFFSPHLLEASATMGFCCRACPQVFATSALRDGHESDTGHYRFRFPCLMCDQVFETREESAQHMDSLMHYEHKCDECGEHFEEKAHLTMHQNSPVHRPLVHKCAFCPSVFGTPSAVVHHLESNCCEVAVWQDIDHLFKVMKSIDKENLFTIAATEPDAKVSLNYTIHGEFYHCPHCTSRFKKEVGVIAHLKSPVHRKRLYHCLNNTQRCGKTFLTLASLWNHLESGSCGYLLFDAVEELHAIIKDAATHHRPLYFEDLAL